MLIGFDVQRAAGVTKCNSQYHACLDKIVDDRTRKFRLGAKGEKCSVCQDEVKVLEQTYKSACKHYFHPDCVKPIVRNLRDTCPNCRGNMRKREEFEGYLEA